jgi:hypothetical protein
MMSKYPKNKLSIWELAEYTWVRIRPIAQDLHSLPIADLLRKGWWIRMQIWDAIKMAYKKGFDDGYRARDQASKPDNRMGA